MLITRGRVGFGSSGLTAGRKALVGPDDSIAEAQGRPASGDRGAGGGHVVDKVIGRSGSGEPAGKTDESVLFALETEQAALAAYA